MKRREGLAKLTGRELYVDDLSLDDCLWGATVRSPLPRGRIRELRFGDGVDWSEIVRVDHRDVPGANVIKLMEDDQPVLAAERVRHVHEPVALLAHPSRATLRRALAAVEVVIEPEPPVLDYRVPPRADQIQHGGDNVFKRLAIDKGDVERALEAAPHVIEGIYQTGAQEHVYLEPQGMVAWLEGEGEDDVVVVQGSMQCPYYVHGALMYALGRPTERVRVVQTPTGGGFGGKEEFPSGVAIHAALLALAAKRPVKLLYERGEDMAATTKRHPSWVRHRTGVDSDGRLLAQDVEILMDAGAYVTLSPVVLSRGVIHAAGPYHCANVRVRGRAVLTNTVPSGAFRGFGAPQTLFACERHMDRIAAAVGLEPAELRRRNLLRDGQTTATGQRIDDGTDRVALLEQALELASWREKRDAHRAWNAAEPYRRRGLGIATFYHGAGFTGAGEVYLDSRAHVASLPGGGVEVRTAATEMGQGTLTIFTQIAADRLGLAPGEVEIAQPDTARVPNSGPTVASRTAMVVGHLVEKACDDLRRQLGLEKGGGENPPSVPPLSKGGRKSEEEGREQAARGDELRAAIRAWHRAHPGDELIGEGRYQPPPGIRWDDEQYRGDAYGTFGWAAYVAEVEVDLRTYVATVIDFVAVQEVGKVLNEVLARGQIQGGVVQAIGWALLEEVKLEDGAMVNNQLTNYIIPTSEDVPPIRVAFVENPYPHGAQGAKGIGELPMDGPAPAILNAVADALGVDPCVIPLTPERLMELVEDQEPVRATA